MKSMVLKEHRQHGDLLLPISAYEMNVCEGRTVLDCHWHKEFELLQVIGGKAQFQVGNAFFEVSAGELLFIGSGELHAGMGLENQPCRYRALVFDSDLICSRGNDSIQVKYLSPLLNGRIVPQKHIDGSGQGAQVLALFDRVYGLMSEKPPAYELFVKASLLAILGELIQNSRAYVPEKMGKSSETAALIKDTIAYLQENYRESITLEALAKRSNMSVGHFCRLFKQYTMKTAIEYLNCYRLSLATELLTQTDRKVIDIALDTGFNSLSYFIHVFEEHMGCSPSQYRGRNEENLVN